MSILNDTTIQRVLDSRLQFSKEHTLLAAQGSSYINSIQFPASNVSDSSVVIQINNASDRVAVDSNLLLAMSFSITVTGTNTSATQPLAIPTMFGPSFLPIQKVISSHSLSINGTTASLQNTNLYVPTIIGAYEEKETLNGEWSMTPSMPDYTSDFLQLPLSATSTRSSLASSFDQVPDQVPRAAFPGFKVVSNDVGATQASFTLECVEPLIVSPLKYGKGCFDQPSLTFINNMLYTSNLANLNRVLSIAYPVDSITGLPTYTPLDGSGQITITSVVVHVTRAQLLVMNFSLMRDVPIPRSIISSYNDVIDYSTTSFSPLAPGQSVALQLQNQAIGSVPQSMIIFVPATSDNYSQTSLPSACTVPDSCLQIGFGPNNTLSPPISINFDNIQQFQSYDPYTLYKICKKNGIQMPYSEFVGMNQAPGSTGRGSVIKLDFGSDIVLNEGTCVGMSSKYNLGLTVNVYNQTQHTLQNVVLHCVLVYDGVSVISDNAIAVNHQASFTPADIARVPLNPHLKFRPSPKIFGGGSFWDKLKSVFTPLNKVLKDTQILSKVGALIPHKGVQAAAQFASQHGYGYHRRPRGGMVAEEEFE